MKSNLLVLALFVLSTGCDDAPTGPAAIRPTITGTVQLYDTQADRYSDDHSGVLVTLAGTNIQATSNAKGEWSLLDVPPGVYTMRLSKNDYVDIVLYERRYSGVGVLFFDTITMWKKVGTTAIQLEEPSVQLRDTSYIKYTTRDTFITWQDTIIKYDSAQGTRDTTYKTNRKSYTVTDSVRISTQDTTYVVRGMVTLQYRPNLNLHIWPEYRETGEEGYVNFGPALSWNGNEFTYVFRKADVRGLHGSGTPALLVWVTTRLGNGEYIVSAPKTLPWP
jgi:hypothetical protein